LISFWQKKKNKLPNDTFSVVFTFLITLGTSLSLSKSKPVVSQVLPFYFTGSVQQYTNHFKSLLKIFIILFLITSGAWLQCWHINFCFISGV